jgi:hypothetical protein
MGRHYIHEYLTPSDTYSMLITPISLGYENKSNTLKYIEMGEVVGCHSLNIPFYNRCSHGIS